MEYLVSSRYSQNMRLSLAIVAPLVVACILSDVTVALVTTTAADGSGTVASREKYDVTVVAATKPVMAVTEVADIVPDPAAALAQAITNTQLNEKATTREISHGSHSVNTRQSEQTTHSFGTTKSSLDKEIVQTSTLVEREKTGKFSARKNSFGRAGRYTHGRISDTTDESSRSEQGDGKSIENSKSSDIDDSVSNSRRSPTDDQSSSDKSSDSEDLSRSASSGGDPVSRHGGWKSHRKNSMKHNRWHRTQKRRNSKCK
jgi:hypothetical protein